jgi:hypothetical protein
VTVAQEPADEFTIGDVIVGSLGVVGALALLAVVLGALSSLGLVAWRRHHPPDQDRLPPVVP